MLQVAGVSTASDRASEGNASDGSEVKQADTAVEGEGALEESSATGDGGSLVDQSEVVVSLDVGGEVVHTPLATVMEGARQGGEVFRKLCGKLLGPGWGGYEAGGAAPAELAASAAGRARFLDIDPRVFAFVLEFLRSGEVLSGDTHLLVNVRAWATREGMLALQRACQESFKRLDEGMVLQLMNGQKNLAGMDMRGLDLSATSLDGASLSRARFNDAHLENASFSGAFADDSDFSGANLTRANFKGVTLLRAKLVGVRAENASFYGAFANDSDFSGSNLAGANFQGVTLLRAKLVGVRADGALFSGHSNRAKLAGADLSGGSFASADLHGASLQGAKLDGVHAKSANFVGAILTSASLVGANLANSNLSGANLTSASLVGANLTNSKLSGANLSQSNLAGVNFSGCNVTGAIFQGVVGLTTAAFNNLRGAHLNGVDFDGVDMGGKDCTGASFAGAKLRGALNLDAAIGGVFHGAIMA